MRSAILVAVLAVVPWAAKAAGDPLVDAAMAEARKAADASEKAWKDGTLKLTLKATRVERFRLADRHDPMLEFQTGYRDEAPPDGEAALVTIDAAAENNPRFSRGVYGVRGSTTSVPSVFYSVAFSGECGDPVILVSPGRLLRVGGEFFLELSEDAHYHGCAGQEETDRRTSKLFRVSDGLRQAFSQERSFDDGAELRSAHFTSDGGRLQVHAVTAPKSGKRKDEYRYYEWKGGRFDAMK